VAALCLKQNRKVLFSALELEKLHDSKRAFNASVTE
jgi:hypothetical protein